MSDKDNNSRFIPSTDLFLGIASIGVGAYHGYCDAQGIPFENENIEFALTYGPAIVQGSLGAIRSGLLGLVGGGMVGETTTGWRASALEKITRVSGGAALGTVAGAGLGGAIDGAKGGIETLVGYGIGYVAGHALK